MEDIIIIQQEIDIPEILGKIFMFIVGAMAIPICVNMLICGFIAYILDFINTKRGKSTLYEKEEMLNEEKQDKIFGFFL